MLNPLVSSVRNLDGGSVMTMKGNTLDDIRTVMWKERKGLFRFRGSRGRFLLTLLTPVVLAAVFPLQMGRDWTTTAFSVFLAAIVPVLIVGITIPESFAGERERHTLGTLLASRLPDRAILFGKFALAVAFAWGLTLLFLLVSLVAVNIAHSDGGILFFTPIIAVADVLLSFLLATLAASAGVVVSMRSATVQEAAQTLMAIFLVPVMLIQVGLVFFLRDVIDYAKRIDGEILLLIVLAILVVLNLILFAAALARFQRSRLLLD
jgi:ABC-2 type transport system permease protein